MRQKRLLNRIIRSMTVLGKQRILALCRKSAADMPLLLVAHEDRVYLSCKFRTDVGQTFTDILMYRAFADPEMSCGRSHGRLVFQNVDSEHHCPVNWLTTHRLTPFCGFCESICVRNRNHEQLLIVQDTKCFAGETVFFDKKDGIQKNRHYISAQP